MMQDMVVDIIIYNIDIFYIFISASGGLAQGVELSTVVYTKRKQTLIQ